MYRLRFHSYCGLSGIPEDFAECESYDADARRDARRECAQRLRDARATGVPVAIVERGAEWEVSEPDDCALIPDSAGLLTLTRTTWECRECGCEHGNREAAGECCAYPSDFFDMAEDTDA